mmetsp:Transcript_32764/g.29051  ORF Transcript_32764/g.29051 Transcript_32764/m.29051 type:complete len:216 (-) Transcript_32764:24-671(-)
MEKHKKILDLNFEMIIDHILYPFASCYFWKHLDKGSNASFELIKKLNRQTKYQKPDFIKTHNLTELDELIASFSLDKSLWGKRQFRFIKDILLPKEIQVKAKFDLAIDYLLKAKEIISEGCADMYFFKHFLIKSGILSDKQIIDSFLAFDSKPGKDKKFSKIWGIQKESKTIQFNLGKDLLYGAIAKKQLEKEERIVEYKYDSFSVPRSHIKVEC